MTIVLLIALIIAVIGVVAGLDRVANILDNLAGTARWYQRRQENLDHAELERKHEEAKIRLEQELNRCGIK